jgi:hypothetical protein
VAVVGSPSLVLCAEQDNFAEEKLKVVLLRLFYPPPSFSLSLVQRTCLIVAPYPLPLVFSFLVIVGGGREETLRGASSVNSNRQQ